MRNLGDSKKFKGLHQQTVLVSPLSRILSETGVKIHRNLRNVGLQKLIRINFKQFFHVIYYLLLDLLMKAFTFTVIAFLALLMGSEALKIGTNLSLSAQVQADAKARLQSFIDAQADLRAAAEAKKDFTAEQSQKIYDWMVEDTKYRAYLLAKTPPPSGDLFLQKLHDNNPKIYLRVSMYLENRLKANAC